MEASFASYCCLCFILFLSLLPIQSVSQYPYLGTAYQTSDCSINHTNSTPNGYYSCAYVSPSSCSSYLIVKSKSHNHDLGFHNISFGNTTFLMKAVDCRCGDHFYSTIMDYNTKSGDSYETIAKEVFDGFTTCSMLTSFNSNPSASSTEGLSVEVPLRCACPTEEQNHSGIQSLAVYMVQPNESITSIARDLLVEKDNILEANMLSNTTQLYPFTPLLVPLNKSETCKIDPSNSYVCESHYSKSNFKDLLLSIGIIIVYITIGSSLSLALFTIFFIIFIISQIFLQIVFGVLALHNIMILSMWDYSFARTKVCSTLEDSIDMTKLKACMTHVKNTTLHNDMILLS